MLVQRILHKPCFIAFAVLLFALPLVQGSCKKDKPKPAEEAQVAVSLNPDPGTTIARAIGATYEFQVALTSAMPSQGVEVSVVYRKDSDNSVLFNQSYSTTTTPLAVSVMGIPFNQVGTVTVVTTSKTKATNTVSKSFKLVRK